MSSALDTWGPLHGSLDSEYFETQWAAVITCLEEMIVPVHEAASRPIAITHGNSPGVARFPFETLNSAEKTEALKK